MMTLYITKRSLQNSQHDFLLQQQKVRGNTPAFPHDKKTAICSETFALVYKTVAFCHSRLTLLPSWRPHIPSKRWHHVPNYTSHPRRYFFTFTTLITSYLA
jgi:hypothetical protein